MLTQANHSHSTTMAAFAQSCRDPAVHSLLGHVRPCAVSFYHTNEVIYAQGEPVGPLYLVEFGTVRICRLTADGRRQISAFHFAGEVFGFEPDGEHESSAECIEDAGIRVLRANSDEGLGGDVLAIALRTLARAQDHLLLLGRMNAAEKMAALLVDLLDRQDADSVIDLTMQRNDIADYLGLTFETVSRVLKVFKGARIIRLPAVNQIEVLNLAALQQLAQ